MRKRRISFSCGWRRTRAVLSFAWLALSGVGVGTEAAASLWQPRSPAPGARGLSFLYQSPVCLGSRLYVVQRGVREYDPARDAWTDLESPRPTPRHHHATAAANGRIYVLAGSIHGEPREWLGTVEEFDIATRSWRERATMPGPRRDAGAAVVDGRIYVLGGEGAQPQAMPIVRYDPQADTWTQMRAATRVRQCWGAQAIGGKIYIVGNTDLEEPAAPVLDEYDPATDTITARTPLPRPRMAFATAVANGRLLVLGGSPGNNVPLAHVDIYDPATDTWSIGPALPEPKCWLGAITLGEMLYVLGGVAGDFSKPAPAVYAADLASVFSPSRSVAVSAPSRVVGRNLPHAAGVLARLEWLPGQHRYGSAAVRIRGETVIYVDPADLRDAAGQPPADVILITHPHDDHFSPETLSKLRKPTTRIVAVADVARHLDPAWDNVTVVAPGDRVSTGNVGIEVVPACNPAGGVHPRNEDWAGYVLTLDGVRLYFSGDTSLTPEMIALRDIDIAVFNVRAPYQMSGLEMVQAAAAMQPRYVIPIHWEETERADLDALVAGAPAGVEVVLLNVR